MKNVIVDEEGPEKREELREERTLWITDQIAQEKFPEEVSEIECVCIYICVYMCVRGTRIHTIYNLRDIRYIGIP